MIVDGGNGGVTAELSKVYTAGGINVAFGGGLNVIDVEGSSALGAMTFVTGLDDDQVTLNQVSAVGTLTISLGDGQNSLMLKNSSAADTVNIGSGSGNDALSIQAVYFNKDLALNAGDGNNGIQMFGSIFGTIASFLTGTGGDNVQLGNNKVEHYPSSPVTVAIASAWAPTPWIGYSLNWARVRMDFTPKPTG